MGINCVNGGRRKRKFLQHNLQPACSDILFHVPDRFQHQPRAPQRPGMGELAVIAGEAAPDVDALPIGEGPSVQGRIAIDDAIVKQQLLGSPRPSLAIEVSGGAANDTDIRRKLASDQARICKGTETNGQIVAAIDDVGDGVGCIQMDLHSLMEVLELEEQRRQSPPSEGNRRGDTQKTCCRLLAARDFRFGLLDFGKDADAVNMESCAFLGQRERAGRCG